MLRYLICGAVAIGITIFQFNFGNCCIEPSGFGTDPDELDMTDHSVPETGIFGDLVLPIVTFIGEYETPIQFRLSQLAISVMFSAMAAYEDKSLDFFARETESEERRRCNDSVDFGLHRRVTLAYSAYFGWGNAFPEALDTIGAVMDEYGLPTDMCENCTCDDVSTPWGLAFTIAEEIGQWHKYDGWNADGSLSREYNRIPYQDFRGDDSYIPRNNPWNLKCQRHWQPLLESDDKGFLFYQESVVPHIGFTSKSVFLTDDEICDMKSPNPRYKYNTEIDLLLNRMSKLNDTTKMEIEYFDSKLTSVLPLVLQYYLFGSYALISDSFEWITIDIMVTNILYEAVVVSWKEKVRWDKVRPPSLIHERMEGEYVTTWAGIDDNDASYGTQTFLADDFEPYIRTMPHAEYPSGSSCVCRAVTNAIAYWEGTDDLTIVRGGPLLASFAAGSSKVEPGSTPAEDVLLSFSSWDEIATRCGLSRLNGGLHFTASVPAGDELCGGIGETVAQAFEKIIAGERPDYVVDINDTSIPNRDC